MCNIYIYIYIYTTYIFIRPSQYGTLNYVEHTNKNTVENCKSTVVISQETKHTNKNTVENCKSTVVISQETILDAV